ncbi:MAG TPA: NTP transferase domain-containing protein [Clostridiaceae bacterium]|nr:NTP transferase domain-containing protein [Clostridiaceae bacterium]
MKTVIMAGGEGTRLRPLTCNRPKPMVPIVNKPVMEHIVELLKRHDLKDIAVTLQYMPELIKDYFNNGNDHGVNIRYYVEKTPLGTAGSVKNAEEFLDDTFLVISGDALTDIDLTKAIKFHHEKGAIATLVLKKVDIPLEYGVVVTDSEGRITRFLEKPNWGEVFSDTVNTGIYILSPEVLGYIKKGEMFDFSKDLFPLLMKENKPMYGYVSDDYWCDVGDLRAYVQVHKDILDGNVKVSIPGKEIKKGIWVDETSRIDESAILKEPCLIGRNTVVKKNVTIESYTVIGDCNIINERTGIKRSIIWKNCILNNNVQIRGSIILNKVHLKDNTSAFEYSVIGDDTIVRENAVIKPGIKIWPDKIIDEGAEVNSNLVWGAKFTRSIFGHRGVAGVINVDITPEYASKLGAAYGASLGGKGKIGISYDGTLAARMLKLSFTSGLLSTGVEVVDFGKMLLPVTRSAIRFYNVDGGIHISTITGIVNRLTVDFLDSKGCNIRRDAERKIENLFVREDFTRCEGECIKEIQTVSGYTDFYLRNIINSIKSNKLSLKISLNSRSKFVAELMIKLLSELGCNVETGSINHDDAGFLTMDQASEGVNAFVRHVVKEKSDLGVSVEDNAEKLVLVDNTGRIVTEDMFMALVSIILFRTMKGRTVVVPISASHVMEKLANDNGGKIRRTKTSHQDIMADLLGKNASEELLDQFTMSFDAMAGLVRILDYMVSNNQRFSELVDLIPDFHIKKKEVECPWNAKGKVIRRIMQENKGEEMETLEGVKIIKDKGWVLVLPDAEKPVCQVISEGFSAEFAEELTNFYADKIREISRE